MELPGQRLPTVSATTRFETGETTTKRIERRAIAAILS
jgi:hypothetical protein